MPPSVCVKIVFTNMSFVVCEWLSPRDDNTSESNVREFEAPQRRWHTAPVRVDDARDRHEESGNVDGVHQPALRRKEERFNNTSPHAQRGWPLLAQRAVRCARPLRSDARFTTARPGTASQPRDRPALMLDGSLSFVATASPNASSAPTCDESLDRPPNAQNSSCDCRQNVQCSARVVPAATDSSSWRFSTRPDVWRQLANSAQRNASFASGTQAPRTEKTDLFRARKACPCSRA